MTTTVEAKWHDVCDRWGRLGYAALTPSERTWLNIRCLIDSIQNGGLISYFYNSGADTLGDCLADLETLGATGVATEVNRVCVLFPEGVPSTLKGRNEIIDSWPEEVGESEIDELLEHVDNTLVPLMAELEAQLSAYLQRSGLAT